ncbi:hypothetical protein HCJ76_44135 [Streptomyces sp. MC1]|uniref:hypothetical protein n=1 Tax=Streptomyces sp. MC1 TaxID=295105 RepID=UPI0018CA10A3|nr:hypothetical protein [Streptomyces sp. MC1]MBG7704874.1 hypothetical protein [Streptomyces sp. MC1]
MTTITHAAMRSLLTAGQAAVRAAEQRATPESVHAVYESLCQLPLLDMDDHAYLIVQGAIRQTASAEDVDTWTLLLDVEHTVSAWLHDPDASLAADDAIMAVARLGVHCANNHEESAMEERAAWLRAYQASVEALRATASATNGHTGGRELDKAIVTFLDAVRRAIPYAALYEARRALVEFARTYGLFIVGMRQPMPAGGPWQWSRRIGDLIVLFSVEPPTAEGFPYGSMAVQCITKDGTVHPPRHFALSGRQQDALAEIRHRL